MVDNLTAHPKTFPVGLTPVGLFIYGPGDKRVAMSEPTNISAGPPPATPTAAPPAKPALPPKPATPAKTPAKTGKSRRFFLLEWINIGWTTMTLAILGMVLGTVRFLFPNVLSEPPSKVKAGFPDQYEEDKVVDRFKDQNFWIVKHGGILYALSTTCTHLGCTPNWLEREEKFKCPCHGSGFKITGVNFEGPAPRPLERWAISIGEDGQIVVDKSKKFQKEMGQWDNPESFIKV
jgi:cytochrome b6-f complex iron-sulfur subunit